MDTRRLWLMWWAGIFAAATIVHLMRALSGASVVIGTISIPLWVSWTVVPLAGCISGWLMRLALEEDKPMCPRPPASASGEPRPTAKQTEEASQPAEQPYCGIQAGAHAADDDDEQDWENGLFP